MEKSIKELEIKCQAAKGASRKLASVSSEKKNIALLNIAQDIIKHQDEILTANKADQQNATRSGMNEAMLDRLILSGKRLEAIAEDTRTIASLPDPVGEIFDMRQLPNGLIVGKKRVPLGVIGAIYESRPNVTIDIASLCLKAGNSVVLRGGSETINSNAILVELTQKAIHHAGLPQTSVQLIENTDRLIVGKLLNMNQYIDLVIPRGGSGLIEFVKNNSSIPVVAGGVGVCHTFVDKAARLDEAVAIAFNAKVQRPTVCNALDCLLVHESIAPEYLPLIGLKLTSAGVEMRCDTKSHSLLKDIPNAIIKPATKEDWGKEFLALVIAIRVVKSMDQALEHIIQYGSGHSEAIITEDYTSGMRFLNEVDAAAVYLNASTRFTDGSQFGLGAELGISTQKMHARGPLGLREITSYKWIIFGQGQVRS
jgi:glutamate-5-semialdehyde dehydrogenase